MSGYFGTQSQQRLQASAEANAAFIAATPGACQTGRMVGCDDLDRFGWERIDAILARDGIIGFRLLPADQADELHSKLADRGFRLDTWEVYLADGATAGAACEAVLAGPLPGGLAVLPRPTTPEDDYITRIQLLLAAAGIAPISGSMLVGALGPAATVAIGSDGGNVIATAHTYLPHNAHSLYHRYAWGGLVAVAEAHRGKRLGAHVNSLALTAAFAELDATHVYELISPSNLPSQRMAVACGLHHDPSLLCGIAMPSESGHFTR